MFSFNKHYNTSPLYNSDTEFLVVTPKIVKQKKKEITSNETPRIN